MRLKIAIPALLLSIVSFGNLFAQDVPARPNPPRLANDLAGLLSAQEVSSLENKLVAIDDSTSTQITVVIVKDLNGEDPNMFAYKIGESWGVGQKGKNNGVVILVKPKTADSRGQVAIAPGYGMEAVVTDALSKRIIENEMIPFFRQNEYYNGIDAAVNAVVLASKGLYKADKKKNNSSQTSGFIIFIIIVIIFIIASIAGRNNKNRHHSIGGNSSIPFWMLLGMGASGRSSGNSWGNFSSGSGGFGGFGGGSFGGGGASGSW